MVPCRIIWRVYHTISLLGRLFRNIHKQKDLAIAKLFGIYLTPLSLSPPILVCWRTVSMGSMITSRMNFLVVETLFVTRIDGASAHSLLRMVIALFLRLNYELFQTGFFSLEDLDFLTCGQRHIPLQLFTTSFMEPRHGPYRVLSYILDIIFHLIKT